jgi:hypothetical protein
MTFSKFSFDFVLLSSSPMTMGSSSLLNAGGVDEVSPLLAWTVPGRRAKVEIFESDSDGFVSEPKGNFAEICV